MYMHMYMYMYMYHCNNLIPSMILVLKRSAESHSWPLAASLESSASASRAPRARPTRFGPEKRAPVEQSKSGDILGFKSE